jgi:Flp pilus assembly protein TadD
MAKTGRNDPCHCGSGKKYKRCCEGADKAATSAKLLAATKASSGRLHAQLDALEPDPYDNLDDDSNGIVHLIRAGKLDEAEKAARELLVRYPTVIDGHERLGMVFEARGDRKQAAAHYRDALDFIARNPEGFEDASVAYYRDKIAELDSPA